MKDPGRAKNALVLTGGGARAAYQVGVLRAIAAITKYEKNPFRIISGYSAGAINGTWLGGRTEHFCPATQGMWETWSEITTEKIFNTEVPNVMVMGFRWLKDRLFGGMPNTQQITYLLDTQPLQNFISQRINFENLNHNLRKGELHAASVTAANYHTGESITFYSGSSEIRDWKSLNRMSVRTEIEAKHVMASSSIPIFFPPIDLGNGYYGDGMVRLNAPLSAAVHLGAERIMVIGIRGPRSTANPAQINHQITIGEIAGTILNGLFFDSLDADISRLSRINRTISLMSKEETERMKDPLRPIPILSLRPSEEVGDLPTCQLQRIPPVLRYLLKGIGLTETKGNELLSYLSFEPRFLKSLLELGYEDTMKRRHEIKDFFESP